MRLPRLLPLALAAGTLAGCASIDPRPGLGAVQASLSAAWPKAELQPQRSAEDEARAHARVQALLAQPLSADSALQIALLNHRGLQARLAELDIAAADVAQAGRLPNPGFSLMRTRSGAEVELERGLHWNLARLLMWPQLQAIEQRRSDAMAREVAMEVLALAAEARRAWVQAVAAEESLRYHRQVAEAAEATAELARRMAQVGNFNKLARAREQAFHAEAALGLARAEGQRLAARERLARALGLWGSQLRYTLPERLPDLPESLPERPDIEREALAQRLDLRAAMTRAESLQRQLGLTRGSRFVNVLELGHERASSNEGHRSRSWEVGFELPIFDSGDVRIARAEAQHRQAVHQAAQVAIEARSEVREADARRRLALDIARHHRDEIVPLRRLMVDEQLLRYNGMLIGVFELMADARAQVLAVNAYLEALRDFWLAQSDFEQALHGRVGLSAMAMPSAAAAPAAAAGH